jgi:hypothetical protein
MTVTSICDSQSSNNIQLQGTTGSVGNVMSNLTHVVAASIVESMVVDSKIIPHLHQTTSGRVAQIEIFSHYVGNQLILQPLFLLLLTLHTTLTHRHR